MGTLLEEVTRVTYITSGTFTKPSLVTIPGGELDQEKSDPILYPVLPERIENNRLSRVIYAGCNSQRVLYKKILWFPTVYNSEAHCGGSARSEEIKI